MTNEPENLKEKKNISLNFSFKVPSLTYINSPPSSTTILFIEGKYKFNSIKSTNPSIDTNGNGIKKVVSKNFLIF